MKEFTYDKGKAIKEGPGGLIFVIVLSLFLVGSFIADFHKHKIKPSQEFQRQMDTAGQVWDEIRGEKDLAWKNVPFRDKLNFMQQLKKLKEQ